VSNETTWTELIIKFSLYIVTFKTAANAFWGAKQISCQFIFFTINRFLSYLSQSDPNRRQNQTETPTNGNTTEREVMKPVINRLMEQHAQWCVLIKHSCRAVISSNELSVPCTHLFKSCNVWFNQLMTLRGSNEVIS